jgi:single-strand DNA-binding protein
MSDGMNRVMLLGNLGADPELRYTQAGMAVLSIRMATTETYVDKNKERQERTEWHTVVVWGARAEALAKILVKGSSVLVEGGLRTQSYEKDGQKRYKTEVHARDLFLTGRRATQSGSDAGGAGRAALAAPANPLDELPY